MQINETGEKMANLKRLEKRLKSIEDWAKALEAGTGPAQTMENMNWLVGQTIDYLRESKDLPEEFLEIFIVDNNFKPTYKIMSDKKEIVKMLKENSK